MQTITIHPRRLRQFGDTDGAEFYFVTNGGLADRFVVADDGSYRVRRTLTFDEPGGFERLLAREIPERAHVLVISPAVFFQSPPAEQLGQRKLVAMACNSTPTGLDAVAHFLSVMEATDPAEQETFANSFFARLETTEHLVFVDDTHGTRARFDHLHDDYEWNEQAAGLAWGEQQIAPAGELSVLPINILQFDFTRRLAVSGELTLRGCPILHGGTTSYLSSDQARLHAALAPMAEHAVVAEVEDGAIIQLCPTDAGAEGVVRTLEAMFAVDSRYRLVWEMGFAINTANRILAGNNAMNETFGGTHGAMHFGLGLTPYTQYHLDIICPGTAVLGSDGRVLFGTRAAAANTAASLVHT